MAAGTGSSTAWTSSRSCWTRACLIIHPRCAKLKAALQNYTRERTGSGDWLDEPADPQHPHEDLMDALRGGVRDRFPEGRVEQPAMRTSCRQSGSVRVSVFGFRFGEGGVR